ncbi:hypothetical protein SY2F82_75700 [Streptomyces sp. Y2F8-2]|uniref:hypothetical protein n=1 Tax=unclassified Streptomyces TaxID=2593676 RepID=UPI001903B7E9|nr:hypothetical protein [Streptomyces sp. Y2F8-2]GHK05773.1 hypothetical protein SY2F82_75700 [Streptomyces sp. Y2F8-2]
MFLVEVDAPGGEQVAQADDALHPGPLAPRDDEQTGDVVPVRALTAAADDLGLDLMDETSRLAGGLVDNPLNPAP